MTLDLAARIDRLESINELIELRNRYFRACDVRDVDVIRDCFLPDAEIGMGDWGVFPTRDAFLERYVEEECHTGMYDTHFGQNPSLLVDGDRASGRWDLYYSTLRTTSRTWLVVAAYYDDEYVRRDGRWWISKSHFFDRFEMELTADADGAARFSVLAKR